MVVGALVNKLDLFRPSKATGYNGAITYTKATLSNIKLGQPSKGWTTDTSGAVRSATATLYYNAGHSAQSPLLSPVFKEGDILCNASSATTPADDRFTVQAVTEQTFKGALHHYEVVLV